MEGDGGRDLGEMMGGEMMRNFMEEGGGMPNAMPILDMEGYGGHVNAAYDDMMEYGGGGRFSDMGENGGRWSDMEAMDHWFDDMEARWSEEEGEERWSDNGRFSDAEAGREEEWGEVEGMEREARRAIIEEVEAGGGGGGGGVGGQGGGGGEVEKGEEEKAGKPERLVSIRTVLGL